MKTAIKRSMMSEELSGKSGFDVQMAKALMLNLNLSLAETDRHEVVAIKAKLVLSRPAKGSEIADALEGEYASLNILGLFDAFIEACKKNSEKITPNYWSVEAEIDRVSRENLHDFATRLAQGGIEITIQRLGEDAEGVIVDQVTIPGNHRSKNGAKLTKS